MPDRPVTLLTMEYLESAHQGVAELFEDDPEPLPAWREADRSKLETLCQCTEVAAFGHEKYPEFHVKVSKFFYSAIKLHAFPNGNKRFALMATIYFLMVNGYDIDTELGFSPTTLALIVARSDRAHERREARHRDRAASGRVLEGRRRP